MHAYAGLIDRCVAFTLSSLKEVNDRTIDALQTSGATSLVKTLQMVRLQKAILAVGMFSLFEAMLQDGLSCPDGFREATRILDGEGEFVLMERFTEAQLAINVLKHGRGRSYDVLVTKAESLSFRIKLPDEGPFYEGDVSEISTLIEVDDSFVSRCAEVIRAVSEVIRRIRPGSLI